MATFWHIFTILIVGHAANVCSGVFTNSCMKCICKVEGCEKFIGKCQHDVYSISCGPYQIKEGYWNDCGSPGSDWQTCTKQMACSETCVMNYMALFGRHCTGGREPVCEDYARIHNGGPKGCTRKSTIGYWQKVKHCCDNTLGCDGTDMTYAKMLNITVNKPDDHN